MHSYIFLLYVKSIETIRIVQNMVFGVDRNTGVLQWDLKQSLIGYPDRKDFIPGEKVLRVTNCCSVVAILGK